MKKRKIVYLFPLAALLLSGCTFAEFKHSVGESWIGQHVLHPIKDLFDGNKENQGGDHGGDQVVAKEIKELIGVPREIAQGAKLEASSLSAKVLYSDGSEKTEAVTKVELDTSKVGETTGKAYVNSLVKEFTITVEAKEDPPVNDTVSPQEAISLMDQAGDGTVVQGLKKVKGICASNSKYDSEHKEYTTGFEGVDNFKVQFTDTNNILNGESPDGMEIVVEGYLEKYNGKYQLSYLPASASPTGEKFTPNLVSASAAVHEGELVSISVSAVHREFYQGSTFVGETVTASYSDGTTAIVKASFSGYDMSVVGEQTVTVSYTEKGVTKEITYQIVVKDKGSGHAGTLEDPLTTAEAVIIANGLAETTDSKNPIASEGFYVKGVVTEFKETFSSNFGNYSVVIGGDFTLWRIKNGPEFAKFNEGDIEVGDEVTAFVYIMNFKGTPESTPDSYVHSVQKASSTKTLQSIEIVGSLTKSSYVEGQSYSAAGLSVKAHYDDGSEATVAATITLNKTTAALGDTEIVASASFGEKTAEPKTFAVTVSEKVPVVGGAVYTFKNDKTSSQNMGSWTSEQFMERVELEGAEIITGMKNPTNVYIGGNGGSGDTAWNIWDCLKIGKSSAKGEITLLLDSTASFSKIKVSAIGSRDDGTLTLNDITKDVTKKAVKGDLEPIELEYDIAGGISELKLSSKDAASNNYGISITRIEFISGEVPPVPVEIDHIEIVGSMTKTSYEVGEAFSSEGLSVKAVMVDGTESPVSGSFEFTPATAAKETTSVSVVAKYSDSFVSEPKTFNVTVEEEKVVNYGSKDAPLTISEAYSLISEQCPASSNVTKDVIFAKGEIKSIGETKSYGYANVIVKDGENEILIYSLNATAEQKEVISVGSVITFSGYGKNYSGTFEFATSNGVYVTVLAIEGQAQPDPVYVEKVEFSKSSYEVEEGKKVTVSATVSPSNADDKAIAYSLTDLSEDGVATIDETTGVVSGLKEGTATIVATSHDGGKTATASLTVNKASGGQQEDNPIVAEGTYTIHHTREEVTYYLSSELGTKNQPLVTTDESKAVVFDFILKENTKDTYIIKVHGEDQYLAIGADDNNGIRFSSSSFEWTIAEGSRETGSYDISGVYGETTRFLTMYNNTDFRCYVGAEHNNRKENTDLTAVVVKDVDSISIKQDPNKKTYYVGESFDPTGMIVTVNYTDGSSEDITEGFSFEGSTGFQSANPERTVKITYKTKTAYVQGVSVIVDDRTITSIKFADNCDMTDKEYEVGEDWNPSGLKVVAVRSDNSEMELEEKDVTFTYDKTTEVAAESLNLTVTASYKVDDLTTLTATKVINVVVKAKEESSTEDIEIELKGFSDSTSTKYVTEEIEDTIDTVTYKANNLNPSSGQVRGNQETCASNFYFYNSTALSKKLVGIQLVFEDADSSNYFKNNFYVEIGDASLGSINELTEGKIVASLSEDKTTFSFDLSEKTFTYFKLMTNEKFTNGTCKSVSIVLQFAK